MVTASPSPCLSLFLQMNCCVDETAAADTRPVSFLRFVPPFAATLPHCDRATIDPILRTGVWDSTTLWGGGEHGQPLCPPSLQQQQ